MMKQLNKNEVEEEVEEEEEEGKLFLKGSSRCY